MAFIDLMYSGMTKRLTGQNSLRKSDPLIIELHSDRKIARKINPALKFTYISAKTLNKFVETKFTLTSFKSFLKAPLFYHHLVPHTFFEFSVYILTVTFCHSDNNAPSVINSLSQYKILV